MAERQGLTSDLLRLARPDSLVRPEAILHLRSGLAPELLKMRAPVPLPIGTALHIRPDPARLHLFEPGGRRVAAAPGHLP